MSGIKGMHWRASTSPGYAEAIRARIRAGGIAKRLEQHVLGTVEMSTSQVQAALGLLRKVVPDQTTIEHSGEISFIPILLKSIDLQGKLRVVEPPKLEDKTEKVA